MRKLGLALVTSMLLNALLAGWLVAQYMSDVYFRLYIDQFFAVNSTYLILTLGVGGGSTAGYLFLRRKGHVDRSSLYGLEKTKPVKVDGGLRSPSLGASQGKILPSGAPPTQPSKHTAYAVPPISKASTPSSSSLQKASPSSNWTVAGKQGIAKQPVPSSVTGPGPKQSVFTPTSTERFSQPSTSSPAEPWSASPSFPSQSRVSNTTPAFNQKSDQGGRPSQLGQDENLGFSKWQSERGGIPGKDLPSFSAPKPASGDLGGMEGGLKRVPIQGVSPLPQQPSPQPQTQAPIPTSKWQAPDSGARPSPQGPGGQWVSPVPRQPYNPAGRPGFPGGTVPSQRPQTPPGSPTMRPGQGPPPRPLFPTGQTTPRPLAYPGASRPMQPGQGTPGGFRPGLVVTGPQGATPRGLPPGQTAGQRPPQSSNFPQSTDVKGSASLSPSKSSQDDFAKLGQSTKVAGATQGTSPDQSGVGSDQKPGEESSVGGEMDWDTALDTILKTLRKDKVGDK